MKHACYLVAIFTLLGATAAQAAGLPLAVTGLVTTPLHLTMADLESFPVVHATAIQASGRGPVPLDCTGASVGAIIAKAALNIGNARNASLAHSLLVTGDDGYAVALSLGEIDPDYGNAGPIIATSCNGKKLDSPRLVVPKDGHAGRAVQGAVALEIK